MEEKTFSSWYVLSAFFFWKDAGTCETYLKAAK